MCPLLPSGIEFAVSGVVQSVIIDGNTTTIIHTFGATKKIVVEGNTTTKTYAGGSWSRKVVDKQGATIYVYQESGRAPWYIESKKIPIRKPSQCKV
jgi:hypothetical protein